MSEAPRMRDDPAADDELRALLRDAPPTRAMPPELRASLGARVTEIAAAPVALAAAKGLSVWAWVGVAAVVTALGAGAWRMASAPERPSLPRASPSAPRPHTAPPAARAAPPSPSPSPHAPSPSPRPPPRPPSPHRVHAAEPAEEVSAARPAPAALPAPAVTSPSSPGAPLTAAARAERRIAEHRLLGQARAALGAGRVDEALGYVAEHERSFADGGMVEERELLAVEALSRDGRGAGRARGERFLARWPGSLYAARVRSLVGAPVDFGMGRDGGVHPPRGGP